MVNIATSSSLSLHPVPQTLQTYSCTYSLSTLFFFHWRVQPISFLDTSHLLVDANETRKLALVFPIDHWLLSHAGWLPSGNST